MDPCGLMMDGLPATVTGDSMRCYITTMRLRENPELLATVRWYRCPPGAKPFPGPHCFGSTFWDPTRPDRPLVGLGEVQRKGTPDRGVAPLGVCGCDTPTPLEWFRSGVPANVQLPYSAGPCPSDGEAFTLCLCGPEISFEEGEAFMRLEDLSDIAVTSVQDGDMLAYSASAGEWLNVPPPAGGVVSFNGRVGAVTLVSADVVNALGGNPALKNAANTFVVGPQTFVSDDPAHSAATFKAADGQTADLVEFLSSTDYAAVSVIVGVGFSGPTSYMGTITLRESSTDSSATFGPQGWQNNNGGGFKGVELLSDAGNDLAIDASASGISCNILFRSGGTEHGRMTGPGSWVFGTAVLDLAATDGFTYIPSCAGTPTGVPTAHPGTVPLVYDTVGGKLWIFNGTAWEAH